MAGPGERPPPPRGAPGEGAGPERPTQALLLSGLPAWPREWAQRVGQEASRLGARAQVHRTRGGGAWELRWVLDQRPLVVLRPTPQGVAVALSLAESDVRRVVENQLTDEELRAKLMRTKPTRGHRRLEVGLDSARRTQSVCAILRTQAMGPRA